MARRARKQLVGPLSSELASVELGDERLNRRLLSIVDRLSEQPSASFPHAMGDDAELEAAYRFFANERVTAEGILEPHFEATAARVGECETVVVVHDTTEFEFGGEVQREGLGRLIRPGQGFFGHFALAVSASGTREPLGLLGFETIFRLDEPTPRKSRKRTDNRGESERWYRLASESEQRCDQNVRLVHVMDREGDSFRNFGQLDHDSSLFVIRSNHDRRLVENEDFEKLREAARSAKVRVKRDVQLSARKQHPGPKGLRQPARRSRTATLSFAARRIVLPRTGDAPKAVPTELALNVVHVLEVGAPKGEEPVEWILLTNLPTKTKKDLEFVVDCYRCRWLIEEFFKAIKTGCKYEKRQLATASSLLNALAVFAPIAWRLLLLRYLAHHSPDLPASRALTTTQLDVLRAISRSPLPRKLTVHDALFAVAELGGHLKRNGDPGWIVLSRGFHDLLLIERGWQAREGRA
jgi:hypothetical protein